MTLSEAKTIADNPEGRDVIILNMALNRLYRTQFSQRTDRALQRFEKRIQNLRDQINNAA